MSHVDPAPFPTMRLMLGGDVMLGRMVGAQIRQHGAAYPLGPIAHLMREADLTVVNLECAITSSSRRWHGPPKAFNFGAPPQAAESLVMAGVDIVSLANNHVLDFDDEGLRDTLHHLHRSGISHAGAGRDIGEALAPAIVDCHGMRFGMAAFCDHQDDFAATSDRPGIAYLDLDNEFAAIATLRAALATLQRARVDWPILSLHWGPNMALRPSIKFRRLAHAAIDMGWKILFGHSAHVFQGIELRNGFPIIYAAGDLVDDYHVDPELKNDHQLLFELTLTRAALQRIELHPVLIGDCQTSLATGAVFSHISAWMKAVCEEMGTPVQQEGTRMWIAGDGEGR